MAKNGKKKATHSVLANQDEIDRTVLDIQNAIRRSMYLQKDMAHMFICKHDLRLLWADCPLQSIFPSFSPGERQSIRQDYICVLSILIYIAWSDWNRFRPLFLKQPGRKDADLPFQDLDFLGTSEQMFSSYQYAFTPVVIEEHNQKHIQEIQTEYRLPFINDPEDMRMGGYGSVTKRVIAPRCLRNKEDTKENSEVCSYSLHMFRS